MSGVITWAVAGGSLVFLIGLISAIGSRRQQKSKPRARIVMREQVQTAPREDVLSEGAMSMAAGGVITRAVIDRKETLASVGSSSR